jgi:hypothetical protein
VQAGQRHDPDTTGQPAAVADLGDRAHLRVHVLVTGDEQNSLLAADVERQRHSHVGEDDGVFQGDEQVFLHW